MLRSKSKLNATYKKVAQAYRTSGGNYLFEIDNQTYVLNTMYKTVSKVINHEPSINLDMLENSRDLVYLDTLASMDDVELKLYLEEYSNYDKASTTALCYSGYDSLYKRIAKLHKEIEDEHYTNLDLDPEEYRFFH